MIRTHIVPCKLPRERCDELNLNSGRIYSNIVSRHWRLLKQKSLWLSQKSLTKLSDLRLEDKDLPMHAHTIDAAQQGFFKACDTTHALRKAGISANFPWRSKKFRTTVWKNTGIRHRDDALTLSAGRGREPITFRLPENLRDVLRFVEVRLVFNRRSSSYDWHIVVENGKQPKESPGCNVVSVDLGEVHPAVVGDEHEATIITCRELRHAKQGHDKRMSTMSRALSRKAKGSRRYKRLVKSKSRMKAKYEQVVRDMEHKISRAIVDVAVALKANTIVIGDVRDAADKVALGNVTNQKLSGWSHGKIRNYTEYKGIEEGIASKLQQEAYTTQHCPCCGHRHKPRGRNYRCPACRFQSHRDVVGQINILSLWRHGVVGKLLPATDVKHRIPHNLRVMRRRADTPQDLACSSAVAYA